MALLVAIYPPPPIEKMTTHTLPPAIPHFVEEEACYPVSIHSWDLKALFPLAIPGDVIESPVLDLKANPSDCHRLNVTKYRNQADDALEVLVSEDGTDWQKASEYQGINPAPDYASPENYEVSLLESPSIRFVKAQLTVGEAMANRPHASLGFFLFMQPNEIPSQE